MPARTSSHSARSLALAAFTTTSLALAAPSARADARRFVLPAGGGLDAIEIVVGGPSGALAARRCSSADCGDAGAPRAIPIPIDRARLDLAHATIATLRIGEGRSIAHVRIPDRERHDVAFEALVGGHDDEPIFAGLTGWAHGAEGDRSGEVVLTYDRPTEPFDAPARFVIVADVREDTRICGQASTPIVARGLDPKSMQLRGATLHRLDAAAREAATPIVASVRDAAAREPIGRVLVANGGSAAGTQALTDGDGETVWSERRPGDGHGEFAAMRAPSEVPIARVVVRVAPSRPSPRGAAPRTFFLATDRQLFRVTMPEDAWRRPGASYEIPLPAPVRTSCVAVVLDDAYDRGNAAPEVSLAEVTAVTAFDAEGATVEDVAAALVGPRAEEAAALLRRSGDEGLAAVTRRWDSLDDGGRALAVDVAASAGTCDGAAIDLLARALGDHTAEVARRARGRIERCGKAATEALARLVRTGDEATRARTAPLLGTLAGAAALDPLGEELGSGSDATRRAMRGAFARAASSAPREALALLFAEEASLAKRLDLLRAAQPRLDELRPASAAAAGSVLEDAPDMATRYLVLQPLAELARSPGATEADRARLAELARRDPDWPIRMRAVEVAAGIAPLARVLVAAAADPEPRVREAALRSLASSGANAGASDAAARALAADPWTFVRVAAAGALAASPTAGTTKTLARALEDRSPAVRSAAIDALGRLRATTAADAIQDRLEDTREDVEVRALAATTLGTLCVRSATDRLTKLARLSAAPVDAADERLGMAAIEALAALHPADLASRLSWRTAKGVSAPARRAADAAVAGAGVCR